MVESQGCPILIINNTGFVVVKIVQIRVSLGKRNEDMWPYIVRRPGIVAANKSFGVGKQSRLR